MDQSDISRLRDLIYRKDELSGLISKDENSLLELRNQMSDRRATLQHVEKQLAEMLAFKVSPISCSAPLI